MDSPDALFPVSTMVGTKHLDALEDAIDQARRDGHVSKIDEGALSIARACARALDVAEFEMKPYATAQVAGPYMEVLSALRMIPASRDGGDNDELADALAALGTATVRDPEDA